MIYSVGLICTTVVSLGSPACSLQHLADACHCLWITVDSLWHWNEKGKAFGLVPTVFFRKIFVLRIYIFFLIKRNTYFKQNKMISKYKTIHISYWRMCFWMNLSKPGKNLSKPGKNTTIMLWLDTTRFLYNCFLYPRSYGHVYCEHL